MSSKPLLGNFAVAGAISRSEKKTSIGSIEAIRPDGFVLTRVDSRLLSCECLESCASLGGPLEVGQRVLVIEIEESGVTVLIGRVGTLGQFGSRADLVLEATSSLTLKCGEAQVNLRADGKVMVKGDDVLIRAKGTQRIRAGSVAIN